MKRLHRKASNSLGLIGILTSILLFILVVDYFTYALTQESIKTVLLNNCDCEYLGGCSAYIAVNGASAMIDKCNAQLHGTPALRDAEANAFFSLTIVGIMSFIFGFIIVMIGIFIIRGISE